MPNVVWSWATLRSFYFGLMYSRLPDVGKVNLLAEPMHQDLASLLLLRRVFQGREFVNEYRHFFWFWEHTILCRWRLSVYILPSGHFFARVLIPLPFRFLQPVVVAINQRRKFALPIGVDHFVCLALRYLCRLLECVDVLSISVVLLYKRIKLGLCLVSSLLPNPCPFAEPERILCRPLPLVLVVTPLRVRAGEGLTCRRIIRMYEWRSRCWRLR
mmetsp:Transcript_61707/g.99826  ORF Transcript_61707/g.99826 Transcript_61707/m.99826 type:complete len:215 (-) Transcript_61707:867-1511(-)